MYLIFVGCLVVFGWEFNIYLKVVVFTFYPTLVVFVMSWVRSAYLNKAYYHLSSSLEWSLREGTVKRNFLQIHTIVSP